MNLSEVYDEVQNILARPDREAEIYNAINFVISKCCLKARFAKDLVEATIVIDPAAYGATIDYMAEVTRFRSFKYIKAYGVTRYLRSIDSDKIFTPGLFMQKDRYYIAGDNLTYTLSSLAPSLEIGYYQYPPTLAINGTETFWLLDIAPYVVIDLASARLFRSIGDDASAKRFEDSGNELYRILRADCEDSVVPEAR